MANIEAGRHGENVRRSMLREITLYIEQHGYSPSVREIAEMVGLKSTSSVYAHLKVMQNSGMIETDAGFNCPRAIRVPGYKFIKCKN